MAQTASRTVRDEYPWGVVEWLASGEIGNSRELSVARMSLPAPNATDRHIHGNCEESVYVVRGHVECHVDGVAVTLTQGEQTVVPRGAAHRLRNVGAEPAEMILSYSSEAREFRLAPGN